MQTLALGAKFAGRKQHAPFPRIKCKFTRVLYSQLYFPYQDPSFLLNTPDLHINLKTMAAVQFKC